MTFAGTGAVFILNAISFVGVFFVLLFWRREISESQLPSERLFSAIRSGMRFASHSSELQASLIRGFCFFIFASASWALLPLIAKNLENGGPQAFGILVASLGLGAVIGAVGLPKLRDKVTSDVLITGASILYAIAMVALASINHFLILCIAMAIGGIAWISILSSLQVAAQMSLPNWVRSRGLAVFMMIFMGSMAIGSLLWGKVAALYGIDTSLIVAAIGMITMLVISHRFKIDGIEKINHTPSMHWPTPEIHENVNHDRGPVFINIIYKVKDKYIEEYLLLIKELSKFRKKSGCYGWGIYQDTNDPNVYSENFYIESWLEHLRQHERVTEAERDVQEKIDGLLISEKKISHYIAIKKG